MDKGYKSSPQASPRLSRSCRKQASKSNEAEHELRIKGLKSSIITVFGDALDKIGFSITEKANRSAQARLGKTLKSIETMENKEEVMYRKQKYEMQMNLDKLHQQQINLRRECIKKASSLDDLDGGGSNFVPLSSLGGYHSHFSGHRNSTESVYTATDYHNRHLKIKTDSKHRLHAPKSAPRSFRSLGKENTASCEQLDLSKYTQYTSEPTDQHDLHLRHDISTRRPATSSVLRNHDSQHGERPVTCHGLRHHEGNGVNRAHEVTSNEKNDLTKKHDSDDLTKKHASEKISFPKLNSKAHFLVHTPSTPRHKQMSKTPDTHRRILKHEDHHSKQHTQHNECSNFHIKKSTHAHDHTDWVPPTKEEMLQMLELEKEELQERINDFLAKKNPK